LYKTFTARNSLSCADVQLRNYSRTLSTLCCRIINACVEY